MMATQEELIARALSAYRRVGAVPGHLDGYCREIEGRVYVVVNHSGACIAAYLVRNNGRLRRRNRWPDVIW